MKTPQKKSGANGVCFDSAPSKHEKSSSILFHTVGIRHLQLLLHIVNQFFDIQNKVQLVKKKKKKKKSEMYSFFQR
jgi:hypothetical protein